MEIQSSMSINGVIKDAKTGELIEGANIYLQSDRTNSAFSNNQGRFSLLAKPPSSKAIADSVLVITNAGYERFKLRLSTRDLSKLTIKLKKRLAKTDKAQQDGVLVTAALANDQRAYGKLMARYRDSIFFMIQKMVNSRDDAEDLTIEAFGKAFQNLHKYSPEYAFSTWLYRIAINNCIDHIRKKRLETFSLDETLQDSEGNTGSREYEAHDVLDPEETYIKQQRILMVQGVIERLNPKYRKLIELRFLKEYSYDEIAKEMKLPLGTVKAQLFRAKELLSNILTHKKERI